MPIAFRRIMALLVISAAAIGACLADSQLYTGDPATIPAGTYEYQLYYDTSFKQSKNIVYSSLTRGVSRNAEVRAAYGYLWNFNGPNAKLGPSVGGKWRFMGDGRKRPSAALSGLYVFNEDIGRVDRKDDSAAALLLSYPFDRCIAFANFGRIWVGSDSPDLAFIAFAVVRPVSRRLLAAIEYSEFDAIGDDSPQIRGPQYTLAAIIDPRAATSYSIQASYLPEGRFAKWHLTLGLATRF